MQLLDDNLWMHFTAGRISAEEAIDKSRNPGQMVDKMERHGVFVKKRDELGLDEDEGPGGRPAPAGGPPKPPARCPAAPAAGRPQPESDAERQARVAANRARMAATQKALLKTKKPARHPRQAARPSRRRRPPRRPPAGAQQESEADAPGPHRRQPRPAASPEPEAITGACKSLEKAALSLPGAAGESRIGLGSVSSI